MLIDLMMALLIVALAAYAVLGGADFGAGFWDLTAGGAERGARLRGLVKRSMGPVWEANHVWLIAVLVIMWTCFPHAFGPLMETLYVRNATAVARQLFLAGMDLRRGRHIPRAPCRLSADPVVGGIGVPKSHSGRAGNRRRRARGCPRAVRGRGQSGDDRRAARPGS